ncbi:hypothetical protein GCM10018980_21610 [Streptomyces capoamus]|uniref:Uncharacterized protein n=1 Tax=Streptomyces capoamus TaxID=68183 RepID=A0A919C315_9ACTN|nr:hypothetical protein GCM10010501_02270 [Streptomyces libani subsp. rufus]GHG44092.1 hypothetical protein GCM10018980_21610 [Streptomyces capoamus]
MARYDSGSGRAAKSADVASFDWIASRMSFTVTVLPPAVSALREGRWGIVGAAVSAAEGFRGVCRRFGSVVLRQRFVAQEVACDAGVRARKP